MNLFKIGAATLAIAIASLGLPATLQAAEKPLLVEGQSDVPTVHVSYADLNLASQAGVDRLEARVRRAATRLCIDPGYQPLGLAMAGMRCKAEAIEGASGQIEVAVARFQSAGYAARSRIAVAVR